MDRRNFLKIAGAAGASMICSEARASVKIDPDAPEFYGVLVDTTRCIGCRSCEVACSTENSMYVPDIENDGALETFRPTDEKQWTVVNRFETSEGDVFVKRQCMHCWQPACTAACPTKAMYKTELGPVVWDGDRCMGCRFCMISCPFEMPKFEYDSWNPKIQKCTLCSHRITEGGIPACVEACPTDAIIYGHKRDLMEVARIRVYNHPDKYVHKIYGEYEAGGTGWLYLSAVPFDEIGFRTDLGTTPYPEFTKDFLFSEPLVLLGATAFLSGLSLMSSSGKNENDEVHGE